MIPRLMQRFDKINDYLDSDNIISAQFCLQTVQDELVDHWGEISPIEGEIITKK